MAGNRIRYYVKNHENHKILGINLSRKAAEELVRVSGRTTRMYPIKTHWFVDDRLTDEILVFDNQFEAEMEAERREDIHNMQEPDDVRIIIMDRRYYICSHYDSIVE